MLLSFAGSQAEQILIFTFIGIFVLTAIITLASLPGWIKLDEWYRKKLFLALIVEVVGIVVMVGRIAFTRDGNDTHRIPEQINWIALDEHGKVVYPTTIIPESKKDSIQPKRLSIDEFQETPELKLKLDFTDPKQVGLLITSRNDVVLGKINSSALFETGLFNRIKDTEGSAHIATIRWEKDGNTWKRIDKTVKGISIYRNFLDDDVAFNVEEGDMGTRYVLLNNNRKDTLYCSHDQSEFNYGVRKTHYCTSSDGKKHYLFRVISADTGGDPSHVNVQQLRIDPAVDFSTKK